MTDSQKECLNNLELVKNGGGIKSSEAIDQVHLLLKRAEYFFREDAQTISAWGRAAAEYPELQVGRNMVEQLLVFHAVTGNLERRFRNMREIKTPQRAKLLDIELEGLLLAEQAPPSALMLSVARATSDDRKRMPIQKYMNELVEACEQNNPTRIRPQKQRRDAGIQKSSEAMYKQRENHGAPVTEAEFGRKRKAAIDAMMAAPEEKRARLLRESPWGEMRGEAAEASVAVLEKAKKRAASEVKRL